MVGQFAGEILVDFGASVALLQRGKALVSEASLAEPRGGNTRWNCGLDQMNKDSMQGTTNKRKRERDQQ